MQVNASESLGPGLLECILRERTGRTATEGRLRPLLYDACFAADGDDDTAGPFRSLRMIPVLALP